MKTILLGTVFLLSQSLGEAKSFGVLTPRVEKGGVIILKVEPNYLGPNMAICAFEVPYQLNQICPSEKRYRPNKKGEVFIGIKTNIELDKYVMYLVDSLTGDRLDWHYEEITVIDKSFPMRRRNIPSKPRNARELKAITEAFKSGNRVERYAENQFVEPLAKVVLRDSRVAGDIFRSFGGESHRGVDLITLDSKTKKHKRPVKAINSGRVILIAKNFSLEGNMAIIDHGSGIFSLYMHLSSFKVKKGDIVKTGQEIGVSGKSGRVTGPHLHFAVKVNEVNVDPLSFLDAMNKYLSRPDP